MSDELASRFEFARAAALEAGRLTLRYFQRADLQVDLKRDASPVTIADRESEQLLRHQIAVRFPNDAVLGEEFGEQSGTSGYRWILDPIDGTKSFIHGVPLYAVLIGVEYHNESRIGVIHLPALDETAYACTGHGAWYIRGQESPVPARVSKTNLLSDGLFCTSGLSGFRKRDAWPFLERLAATAKLSRTWGDAYGYLLVATGRAELMVDPALNVWDAAAMLPVIQEAGGTFTDWHGRATIYNGEGIASNGLMHEEILRLVGN
jgi:histidinol phosphatase-like enzyme (inositol monophosphatase family)